MGVDTPMARPEGGMESVGIATVLAAGAVLAPSDVADAVIAGVAEERFLILPHPEVLEFFRRKASDYDRWLAGMRRLRQRRATGRGDVRARHRARRRAWAPGAGASAGRRRPERQTTAGTAPASCS